MNWKELAKKINVELDTQSFSVMAFAFLGLLYIVPFCILVIFLNYILIRPLNYLIGLRKKWK